MILFLNGQFVPEASAVVSVFDRSFLYGDGLFETLLVCHGKPFRWQQHLERLQRGAEFLQLRLPFTPLALTNFSVQLIARNNLVDGLLRLSLSRGVGPRGYSPRGANEPFLVMTCFPSPEVTEETVGLATVACDGFPLPFGRGEGQGEGTHEKMPTGRSFPFTPALSPSAGERENRTTSTVFCLSSRRLLSKLENLPHWKLATSSFSVPAGEKLSTFKTCNKLPQIMARAEAESAGADEGLLLNTNGEVAEAASSNLFWIANDEVCTTPLANGVLAGVTRGVVFEICDGLGLRHREITIKPEALRQAQGVFLSLSSLGIVEAESLDQRILNRSPMVSVIQRAYAEIVEKETSRMIDGQTSDFWSNGSSTARRIVLSHTCGTPPRKD